MSPRRLQSRSWFGTLNNYTDEELLEIRTFDCLYKAIGFHTGEKSHLPHIHCIIQFKTPRGFPKLSKRWHWETRKGSVKEALDYLNKQNRLEEYGERPCDKSVNSQWPSFVASIHDGTVDKDSLMYARYEGYVKRRLAELTPRRTFDGELSYKNIWIVGPPGCGKSRMVHDTFSDIYFKSLNKWWDQYEGQKCVLIEDADPNKCEHLAYYFKIWADRYSFAGELKCGRIQINASDYNLVVTSNYSIEECFPNEKDWGPILRRFDVLNIY